MPPCRTSYVNECWSPYLLSFVRRFVEPLIEWSRLLTSLKPISSAMNARLLQPIDAVGLHDALKIADRRRAVDRQHRLDGVLELLGVAVPGRVPHAVEYRPDDLRLIREDRSVQRRIDDVARDVAGVVDRIGARVV